MQTKFCLLTTNLNCVMKRQLQLILSTCIVNLSWTTFRSSSQVVDEVEVIASVAKDGAEFRQNFQNLFDSISKNEPIKSGHYREILKNEVEKGQKAYDVMEDEFQIARSSKKKNTNKNVDSRKSFAAKKRETDANKGDTVCIAEEAKNGSAYRYKFTYATYIAQEERDETSLAETKSPSGHICSLEKEEKMRICMGALAEPFAKKHNIELVDNLPVLKVQFYEIKRSGFEYANLPPIKIDACVCPTNPPLYLNDNSSGKDIDIFVSLRDNLADVVGPFPGDE